MLFVNDKACICCLFCNGLTSTPFIIVLQKWWFDWRFGNFSGFSFFHVVIVSMFFPFSFISFLFFNILRSCKNWNKIYNDNNNRKCTTIWNHCVGMCASCHEENTMTTHILEIICALLVFMFLPLNNKENKLLGGLMWSWGVLTKQNIYVDFKVHSLELDNIFFILKEIIIMFFYKFYQACQFCPW
jgi:hypothetical protein